MKKITAKTTKQELKDMLGANVASVREVDKDLFDRIAYADKVSKTDDSKVTRKDLVDLVNEVAKVLGDKFVEPTTTPTPAPKAENSVKLKGGKKAEKKVEEPTEAPADEPKAEKVDEKKSSKKSSLGKKKEEPKKDGVTVLNETKNPKAVQLAKMFPKTLEVGDAKYEIALDIKNMDDLHNALANEDKEIVFAFYWTKRHLKQFVYFGELLGQPESFDNDLDLATALYVSDEKKVAYALSMYTESFYTIMPEALIEEDGIRFCSGVEFQIYRAV